MKKILEYMVVGHKQSQVLAEMVNELFTEGWKPQGGLSCAYDKFLGWTFYQALTRKNKKNELGN